MRNDIKEYVCAKYEYGMRMRKLADMASQEFGVRVCPNQVSDVLHINGVRRKTKTWTRTLNAYDMEIEGDVEYLDLPKDFIRKTFLPKTEE